MITRWRISRIRVSWNPINIKIHFKIKSKLPKDTYELTNVLPSGVALH